MLIKNIENQYEMSVIIPTYNRMSLLPSLLESWKKVHEVTKYKYEIIFSDDGSEDDTLKILEDASSFLPIKIIKNEHGGAAKARNAAILNAGGEKLLIIGDDIYPNPQLLNQHYEKLLELGTTVAVLGGVEWHHQLELNHLMYHITDIGNEQFSFNRFKPHSMIDFRHFYTCNISIDRKFLLEEAVIFDNAFSKCNFEDIELGYRLEQRGMQIYYYPEASGEHYHPYNIRGFCRRMQTAGEMAVVFEQLHPEISSVVGVTQIITSYNLISKPIFILFKITINFDEKVNQLIKKCETLEEKIIATKNTYDGEKFKCALSVEYIKLFKLYYDIGVLQAKYPQNKKIQSQMYLYYYRIPFRKYLVKFRRVAGWGVKLFCKKPKPLLNITRTMSDNSTNISLPDYSCLSKSILINENGIVNILLSKDSEYLYNPLDAPLSIMEMRQVLITLLCFNLDFVLVSRSLKKLPYVSANNMNDILVFRKSLGYNFWECNNLKIIGKILHLMPIGGDCSVIKMQDIFKTKIHVDDDGFVYLGKKINEIKLINSPLVLDNFIKSKKLIFVWPIFMAVGGVERNTIEIIRQLKNQYHFIVITMEKLIESQGSLHHQLNGIVDGIIDLAEISPHKYFLDILKQLKLTYKPDLIWICNGSPWLVDNALKIRHLFHDIAIVDQQVYDIKEGWINHYHELGIQSFNKFIAINQKIYDIFIQKLNMDAKNIVLIYSATNTDKFLEKKYITHNVIELKNKYKLPIDDKRIVLFMGRLVEQKMPLNFVKLAKQNKDINFLMVGDGHLSAKIDDYVVSNKLKNFYRIKFVENTAELFSIIDAIVFLSAYEGLPIAMIEAMVCEVPVFSTDVGDNKLIIEEFNAGLVVTYSKEVNDFCDSFNTFINNLDGYKFNLNNNSKKIADKFSSKYIAKQYAEVFNELIK